MSTELFKRQKSEENYHNQKFKSLKTIKNAKRAESKAYKFYSQLKRDVKGMKTLDFGCGNGWISIDLAKSGALVWGIDISEELIRYANNWAEKENLSDKIKFKKMTGEDLNFDDNFFDLVLGSAILHHTEIKLSLMQIFRVLKPGGRALFIEPMNQNIFLKTWRKLTPWRRSPTERALTHKDIMFIREVFPKMKPHYFGFISIFTSGLNIIFGKNKIFEFANIWAEKFDEIILKTFPFLGKYCSVVVLELEK